MTQAAYAAAVWTPGGRIVWLVLATAVMPATAIAQTPSSPSPRGTPRERVAVGIALIPVALGAHEFYPTARLSAPLAARIGVDVDVGRAFPTTGAYYSNQVYFGVGVRFLRSGRTAPEDSSRYWSVGPAYFVGKSLDGHGQVTDPHSVISALKLGYGAGRVFQNGVRAAGEIGVIGGGGSSPTGVYATLVVQWQPRR